MITYMISKLPNNRKDDSLWTFTHSDIIISQLCLKFSKDEYNIRIERYRKVVATIYVVVVIVVRVLWMRGYHTTISYVVASIAFSWLCDQVQMHKIRMLLSGRYLKAISIEVTLAYWILARNRTQGQTKPEPSFANRQDWTEIFRIKSHTQTYRRAMAGTQMIR